MNLLDFNCEIITPLFSGGAETRLHPELRGPSVRGAMRYWYRALVGGSDLVAAGSEEERLKALKQHETQVFGNTERGSPISVIVRAQEPVQVGTFQKDKAIRTEDGGFLPSGKDYLLWSMAASGRPDTPRYQPDREFIQSGTKFTIRLQSPAQGGEEALRKATASLWLLANLGALGSRANRGAGSFQVQTESPANEWVAFKSCRTIEELQLYLSKGIRQCLSLIGNGAAAWRNFAEMPAYDVLCPTTAEVWVVSDPSDGWGSAMDALNGIGARLRDYRSHRSPLGKADHDAVLNWLEGGDRNPQIRRAVFGLPIPFRYSEGGPSDVIISEVSDRRASPLRIRVTRLSTGRYVGVLTLFKSCFLPKEANLQLQTRRWEAPAPTDYEVIRDFIQTFQVRKEVSL